MTVTEQVYALLHADAGVTAIVGNRIYVPGDLQAVPAPYIVHFPVTVQFAETHEAIQNLKIWRYQVSCIGTKYSDAEKLAVAVRIALGRVATVFQSFAQAQHLLPYAPDERVAQIAVEFEIAESL